MAYECFELPSSNGTSSDVVLLDAEHAALNAFVHYAYAVPGSENINNLNNDRGIPTGQLRDWHNSPNSSQRVVNKQYYYPGQSVLESGETGSAQTDTSIRLGALETLANIFSGRITLSDKDPFPHQLSLQQFMANNYGRTERLLIADEVGLGKTIEAGLILRDALLKNNNLSCLYLTRGGLRVDVKNKLKSVIGGSGLVDVITSFTKYGEAGELSIRGIKIGSIEAARRYASIANQKNLPNEYVAPDIIIIDECHYCSAREPDLQPDNLGNGDATQAYRMAYQMINGSYWLNSNKPQLVILMSATPFRSDAQFLNLLRLLSHGTKSIPNAFDGVTRENLVKSIKNQDSSITIVWRQQEQVRNWSGNRFFPKLRIIRPHQVDDNHEVIRLQPASDSYVALLTEIKTTLQSIHRNHKVRFGGFAVRQLEQKLTSSSIAGSCAMFRWCVQHASWQTQEQYKQDNKPSANQIRDLIRKIATSLAQFNQETNATYSKVEFASDDFVFEAGSFQEQGNIPAIAKYKAALKNSSKNAFIATEDELLSITNLGLKLLAIALGNQSGVENIKLNWLQAMLERFPNEKFLIFAESLQTCTVISTALGNRCGTLLGTMTTVERDNVTVQFCNVTSKMQALVATACADEGFDFQVANHIVHWDLHPSPATLMQRNGRLARLGQVADVTAYYLIVQGTHEERREQALIDRFIELGINDEALRLKILGQLDDDQEKALAEAVELNNLDMVGELLITARDQDALMTQGFNEINTVLACRYVLDRNTLLERLKLWGRLGFQNENINIEINDVAWERPVFDEEGTHPETANASIVRILEDNYGDGYKLLGQLAFDPEFKVFGGAVQNAYRLAGLAPWTKREKSNGNIIKIRPVDNNTDPISYLTLKLARQVKSDFAAISRSSFIEAGFTNSSTVKYLLITTHPIKEKESMDANHGYMSFFCFDDDCNIIYLNGNESILGASAEETHKLITSLEKYSAMTTSYEAVKSYINQNKACLKADGQKMGDWLRETRLAGGGLLGGNDFFMPIAVAMIAIID